MEQRRVSLSINYAIIIMYAVVVTMSSPLLMYIAFTFKLSLSQAGILFTANYVGFVSLIMVGGIFADRLSNKTVLTVANAGITLMLLLFARVPNIYIACLVMLFIGGFGGTIQSITNAIVGELYPEKSTFYMNLAQVFFGVGALIGPITVGLVVQSGTSWQNCYLVSGMLFLILTLLFFFHPYPVLSQEKKGYTEGFREFFRDGTFLWVCVCLFLYTGAEVGAWGWLSTFVKQNLHFSMLKSSFTVGLFWTAMIVGRFSCTILTRHIRIKYLVITLSLLAGIVTLMFGVFSNHSVLIWLLIALMGLTYSGIWPLLVAFGCERFVESKGTVSSLLIGSGGVGAAVTPLVMGVIAQNLNTQLAIISPSLLLLILGLSFWRMVNVTKVKKDENVSA